MSLAAALTHRECEPLLGKKPAREQTGYPGFGYPAKDQRELAAVVAG